MKTILFFLLFIAQTASATNYYFSSVSGHDSRTPTEAANEGTPWRSINKLNSFFSNLKPGDAVLFKKGEIFYGQIIITKSGSSSAPIRIGAYGVGNNKPIITGLEQVTFSTNNGNVYYSNQLATDATYLNLVTVNTIPVGMGRYPDAGTVNGGYQLINVVSGNTITGNGLPNVNFTNAEIVLRPKRYLLDKYNITNHDVSAKKLTFTASSKDPPCVDCGYFIQNHIETLTAQNEWYFNRDTKKLLFYSTSSPTNVQAATLENLVTGEARKYITIDNIYFNGANSDIINIKSGNNIDITNCNFVNAGKNGISTEADHSKITNNSLNYCLNNGIVVTYNGDYCEIMNNVVENTHTIAGMGQSKINQGIAILVAAANVDVLENMVFQVGYVGIKFGAFNAVTVKRNIVNSFGFIKDDGGGIYTETGLEPENYKVNTGRIVESNIVSNGIGAPDGAVSQPENQAHGIYFDDGANGIEASKNTVFNCGAGFYLHNVDKINLHDNTAFDNTNTQFRYKQDVDGAEQYYNCRIMNNIWFSKTSSQRIANFEATGDKLNRIGTNGVTSIDNNYYAKPIGDESGIFYDKGSNIKGDIALPEWRTLTSNLYDVHSAIEPTAVTNTSQIRFEYNNEKSSKTITLDGYRYVTVKGIQYSQNIVLAPFTSAILMRDNITWNPEADAYVRNGTDLQKATNYGAQTTLEVKGSGYTRNSYLRFPLTDVTGIESAKLRVYGKNSTGSESISMSAFGVSNDSWQELGITWKTAPSASGSALSSVTVNNTSKYYELDVTDFVESRLANGLVSFVLKDTTSATPLLSFNSRDNIKNKPQLIIMRPPISGASAYSRAHSVAEKSGLAISKDAFSNAIVYPNPIQNSFAIAFPTPYHETFKLQLIDQVGRVWNLGTQRLQPGQPSCTIDISTLELIPGVYYLKINARNKTIEIKKIIINKVQK